MSRWLANRYVGLDKPDALMPNQSSEFRRWELLPFICKDEVRGCLKLSFDNLR